MTVPEYPVEPPLEYPTEIDLREPACVEPNRQLAQDIELAVITALAVCSIVLICLLLWF